MNAEMMNVASGGPAINTASAIITFLSVRYFLTVLVLLFAGYDTPTNFVAGKSLPAKLKDFKYKRATHPPGQG